MIGIRTTESTLFSHPDETARAPRLRRAPTSRSNASARRRRRRPRARRTRRTRRSRATPPTRSEARRELECVPCAKRACGVPPSARRCFERDAAGPGQRRVARIRRRRRRHDHVEPRVAAVEPHVVVELAHERRVEDEPAEQPAHHAVAIAVHLLVRQLDVALRVLGAEVAQHGVARVVRRQRALVHHATMMMRWKTTAASRRGGERRRRRCEPPVVRRHETDGDARHHPPRLVVSTSSITMRAVEEGGAVTAM